MDISSTGKSDPAPHKGGYGTLIVAGDLTDLTVTVEADYGVGEWIVQRDLDGDPITVTASQAVNFLTSRCQLRLSVDVNAGAAAPDPSEDLEIKWSIRDCPVYASQNR